MYFLRILVAAVVVSCAVGAEIGQLTCGKNYQDALNKAVSLKEDCENAAFYDCCQVCKKESLEGCSRMHER